MVILNFLLAVLSFSPNVPSKTNTIATSDNLTVVTELKKVEIIFNSLDANNFTLPNKDAFITAYEGYEMLKNQGKIQNDFLTIVDFSLSSRSNRLWIIDMKNFKIVHNTLVAHGKNSGEDYANIFSNVNSSNKSSLGFYLTGESYVGKHGLSMRLDGLQKGLNDKARERGIVVHAADYVSEYIAKNNHRLGRSQGCPALPAELCKTIIQKIKNKSCLFIYHPSIEKVSSRLIS